MKTAADVPDLKLGRKLVLDELFDLNLYRRLWTVADPDLKATLAEMIETEEQHFSFWQDFFKLELPDLDPARKFKLFLIFHLCRIFGAPAAYLVLDAIEVYGIRKYLQVWEHYKGEPLGDALRNVLEDEFGHEDEVVTRLRERLINPDRVRNIFLGVNDGLVEILGAVSGFFASFGQNSLVLLAGLTTAVAGAISMGAGAFVAMSSESEVRRTQDEKSRFLGNSVATEWRRESGIKSGLLVGISYFIGAAFPLLPVLFGAATPVPSILTGGSMILLISMLVAFLSGMNMRRRVITNLVLIALAVVITYALGVAVRNLIGIEL